MKEKYEKAECEILEFEPKNILTATSYIGLPEHEF